MLMGAHDGGIEDQILEIRIIGYRHEHAVPDALGAPAAEAPKCAVPVAEILRQVAPWRPSANDPQHGFDKHPVIATARAAATFIPNNVAR